jgi:hypothetical protein
MDIDTGSFWAIGFGYLLSFISPVLQSVFGVLLWLFGF